MTPTELSLQRGWTWPRRWALALTTLFLVVGPWPVDDSSFEGSSYQTRTLARLNALPAIGPPGPIQVGLAEVDLTPSRPRPLAGFIGQIRTPYVGVDSPCLARALTIESVSGLWTILTADLLLIDARLAQAAADRAGVPLDRIFFTSSHTHGGPGGWGNHPLEMLVAGAYDPASFNELADHLAEAIRGSMAHREPASLGLIQTWPTGRQSNRVDPAMPTHDELSALVFRKRGEPETSSPLALLVVFGAHATVSHPVPPRLGGDYPASLVSELKQRTGARMVLFASGAVGDASPARPKASSQAKSARALGNLLAGDLMAVLPSAPVAAEVVVGGHRLEVAMPPVRLPFLSRHLRFSPLLSWWIADRTTHLQALRLGSTVLVGFPGDYSGHLARRLVDSTRDLTLTPVATSFNGDYRGYLVSGPVFRDRACYETRWMNFYGPEAGDYLNDLARRLVARLANRKPEPGLPAFISLETWFRVALAGLLGGTLAVGWNRRLEVRQICDRAGWLAVSLGPAASLGFVASPDLWAWDRVGLPGWAQMMGIPLGIFALLTFRRGQPGRGAWLLGWSIGLLGASWLVVLMSLRGWARWGLKKSGEADLATTTAG